LEKKIITAREIFLDARSAFVAEKRYIYRIMFIGMFLPLTVLSFALDLTGIATTERVRDSFFADSLQVKEFTAYLAQILPYFSATFLASAAVFLFIIVSYFLITGRVAARIVGAGDSLAGSLPSLVVKKVLPAIFALAFLAAVSSALAQIALLPAIFIVCLATMFPVLQFAEGHGAFRSLWNAVTLRYGRRGMVSGWNIFLNMISIGACCYTLFVAFAFLGEVLLFADSWLPLPRAVWFAQIPGTGLGVIYSLISLLENLIISSVLAGLALLTTALYFKVIGQHRSGSTGHKILAMA
jgi:hypothetical protein